MRDLLQYMGKELKDCNRLTLIVAGMLVSKNLNNPEHAVKKILEMNQLASNIQLEFDKELIMHSTHTLKRFVTENTEALISSQETSREMTPLPSYVRGN